MIWSRNRIETTYSDGRHEVFDPAIRGCFHWTPTFKLGEIGTRNDYAIGFMLTHRVGNYTVYRKKWIRIGSLTLYVNLGVVGPHNPLETA